MKLYLVHCGFYDARFGGGIYESHTNFLVVASSFEDARLKVKEKDGFRGHEMHVDGLQELDVVGGHRVRLDRDYELKVMDDLIVSSRHRDLAPKSPGSAQRHS